MHWGNCFCCKPCRPKYRRMVDNIYPVDPNDGLVQNNLSKLIFYVASHPEKLGRVGEYLDQKIDRDLYYLRYDFVKMSVDAMNSLLTSCHASPSLNFFIDSFFKVIEKLLDLSIVELNLLAAKIFVDFSKIDEEAPNYSRPYTYLTERFSQMCHSDNEAVSVKRQLRIAGIRGLLGVIRKLVSDELQANLWEEDMMKQIIPALVFNFHDDFLGDDEVDSDKHQDERTAFSTDDGTNDFTQGVPQKISEDTLRELASKANFANIKFIMDPLLNHLTSHKLWGTQYAVDIFKVLMYSMHSQYSFAVIEQLIEYLSGQKDATIRHNPLKVRIGVAEVLNEIIVIGVATIIGPGLLEVFNNLLRYLRVSVEYQCSQKNEIKADELKYQDLLISTIGKFADYLPDYQKVEVMLFIIGKVPVHVQDDNRPDRIFQGVLVRTLLKVATKYKTQSLANTLTSSFLEQLLKLSLVDGHEVRLNVQQILHTLLDRHNNLPALENLHSVGQIGDLQLKIEQCSRADALFMRKNLPTITQALFRSSLAPTNHSQNYEAIFKTIALLCLESGHDSSLVELFRLVLGIQAAVVESPAGADNLSPSQKAQLHNLVAVFFSFSTQLSVIPSLVLHAEQVIKLRAEKVAFLNVLNADPPMAEDDFVLEDDLLFDKSLIMQALQSGGNDATRLNMPFQARGTNESLTVKSPNDTQSIDGISLDVTSGGSLTPITSRRGTMFRDSEKIPVTFEALKLLAQESISRMREEEAEKSRKVIEMFRNVPFETLVQQYGEKRNDLSDSISRALAKSRERSMMAKAAESPYRKPKSAHEIQFPELFVY